MKAANSSVNQGKMLNSSDLRKAFPIYEHSSNLVYLDSASTSLKAQSVLDSMNAYYRDYSANIHRGLYKMSEKATAEYEMTRSIVASFIGTQQPSEIVFTRGTTESLNILMYLLGQDYVNEGDEIVLSIAEHHSNFVPWQHIASKKNATLRIAYFQPDGKLNLQDSISEKTKIVTLGYVSNVLGYSLSLKEIIMGIRKVNKDILVVVDAAQAVLHEKIDVVDLDCDFLAFSGHKMYGPTGVGVLWMKQKYMDEFPPFHYGGDMVNEVTVDSSTYLTGPQKYEAGTPHISGVIGLGAAIQFIQGVGIEMIHTHSNELAKKCMSGMQSQLHDKVTVVNKEYIDQAGMVTFNIKGVHPHDVAQVLDEKDVSVRAGHHCAMPLHAHLGLQATVRASFSIYNTVEDVDSLLKGLVYVAKVLSK